MSSLRRSYFGRVVADAVARHPGGAQGRRLRLFGSLAVPALVGILISRFVSVPAVPDAVLILGFGVLGAVLFNAAVFLWNAALAPSRIERAVAARHAVIVESMQAELDQKLKPFQIADAINDLRFQLRELGKDAYQGETSVPKIIWNDRCVKFLAACEAFVKEQRNKHSVALHDAIRQRVTQNVLEIGKNPSTIDVLNRVDQVLATIADELRYE